MSNDSLVLLKLGMGRNPPVDVQVPFELLPEICRHYFDKGSAISYIMAEGLQAEPEDPSNAIYISDIDDSDESYLSLLLVRGDPGRTIPGFVNAELRAVKAAGVDEPGYVPGGSSHLIIGKKGISKEPDVGRQRAVLERTRGIGRELVRSFLAQLMARFAEEFPDRFVAEKKRRKRGEKPEKVQYKPTIRFHPQPNASLKEDLENGRIGGFRLTRGAVNYHGEADEPHVQRLNVQLQAHISPTEDIPKLKKLVDRVQQSIGNVSFDSLNLELVDEQGEPINSTQPMPVEHFTDSDLRYCKLVMIPENERSKNECEANIVESVRKFAIASLTDESHWK